MTNTKESKKPSHLPDRSDLSKLYFEPKTYDQKQQELTKLATFRRQSTRKHLPLKTASYTTLAFLFSLTVLANFDIIMIGSIPIIFFFFCGLITSFFLSISAVKYIANTHYIYDKSPTLFWVLYFIGIFILATCVGTGVLRDIPTAIWLIGASFVHFLLIIIYLLITDSRSKEDG